MTTSPSCARFKYTTTIIFSQQDTFAITNNDKNYKTDANLKHFMFNKNDRYAT